MEVGQTGNKQCCHLATAFLTCDAYVTLIAQCPGVCLSVCLSVTSQCSIETTEQIELIF